MLTGLSTIGLVLRSRLVQLPAPNGISLTFRNPLGIDRLPPVLLTGASPSWLTGIAYTLVAIIALFGIPAAMTTAILRHRLYDIDRIISRTLEYAIVTGLLVRVYAGLVLLATQALPVSLSTPVAVAVATLAAAALFSPLRRRSSRSWTGGSTGSATTWSRPWRRSRRG